MEHKISGYKYIEISYNIGGNSDKSLIFLHGYLETNQVWTDFIKNKFEDYKIITINLLGHGGSGIIKEDCSISEMAKAVNSVLEKENITKTIMIGHSMGGYVTLEFAKLFPNKLTAFSLFHSTAYSDNDKKIAIRNKAIEFINQGKKDLIINTAIPNTFNSDNINLYNTELESIILNAKKINNENIIYAINSMINRDDNIDILRHSKIPILFVIGEKDNCINSEDSITQSNLSPQISTVLLKNSGHMGFIEEKGKLQDFFSNFIIKLH